VIETSSTDVSQTSSISNEVFLTTFYYDSLNRLQQKVDNIGQTVCYSYDSRNNLVSMTDANGPLSGAITRRSFPGGALTANTINGYGNVTLFIYDGLNRKIRSDRVMTASGQGDGIHNGANVYGIKTAMPTVDTNQAGGDGLVTVTYQRDGNSLLTSQSDDNGNQTQMTYDNHNRMLTETKGICTPPNLANVCATPTTEYYQYDADGDLIQFQDANGSVTTNHFDALSRLISTTVARAANVVGTTAETCQYDGLSRLTLATDNNDPNDSTDDSAITYAYDSLSRVVEETQQIGPTNALAIDSAWVGLNRAGTTYPNGRQITKTFDSLHRLTSVSDLSNSAPIATYSYIGRTRVGERAYPQNDTALTFFDNGNANDIGYDGLRRPVEMRSIGGTNDDMLVGFDYTYDRDSKPLSETKLHALNDSELYDYDSAYRLLEFGRGTLNSNSTAIVMPSLSTTLQTNWTLDGVGNWNIVDNETRQYNSFNELIQRSNTVATVLGYDRNGNETNTGSLVLQYDFHNRLRTVSSTNGQLLAFYYYDAFNRRISKVVTNSGSLNGTTVYYLDGQREVEERNGTNGLSQQYVYGRYVDEPLVLDRDLSGGTNATGLGNQRLFYHQNRHHSVFALTDVAGKIIEGYQYEGYGTPTVFDAGSNGIVAFGNGDRVTVGGASAFGNPYGFTGRRFDPESGLYYYRNRYLAPDQGRFISRDIPGFSPCMNLYEYAQGNPAQSRLGALATYRINPALIGNQSAPSLINSHALLSQVDACAAIDYGETPVPHNAPNTPTAAQISAVGAVLQADATALGNVCSDAGQALSAEAAIWIVASCTDANANGFYNAGNSWSQLSITKAENMSAASSTSLGLDNIWQLVAAAPYSSCSTLGDLVNQALSETTLDTNDAESRTANVTADVTKAQAAHGAAAAALLYLESGCTGEQTVECSDIENIVTSPYDPFGGYTATFSETFNFSSPPNAFALGTGLDGTEGGTGLETETDAGMNLNYVSQDLAGVLQAYNIVFGIGYCIDYQFGGSYIQLSSAPAQIDPTAY
jgi:RHS repeat-associated protein